MGPRSDDEGDGLCPCGSGLPYSTCCQTQILGTAVALEPPPPGPGEEAPESRVVRATHDALWEAFEALPDISVKEMDELLTRLLALPHDYTSWGDVLREFEKRKHPDIRGVYRRIAAEVRATSSTELAFFHWAAAELFSHKDHQELLPEVAAGFARLDKLTYDPDGLAHIEDHLLAARFDAATLSLAERFLPITREGEEEGTLTPYVMPFTCALIFQLRVGLMLREALPPGTTVEQVARRLRQDLDHEIDLDAAEHAAHVILDPPRSQWSLQDFRLPEGDIADDNEAWKTSLALYDALIDVAREAWLQEQISPGYGFRALCRLLESVHDAREDEDAPRNNLLDYLDVPGLEERIAQSCADILGTNESQARVMLHAYELLLRFTQRHQLLPAARAQALQAELTRLGAMVEI